MPKSTWQLNWVGYQTLNLLKPMYNHLSAHIALAGMVTNALARHNAYAYQNVDADAYRLEELKICTSDVHVPDTASAIPITMTATSATSPVHPISAPKTLT